MAQHDALLTDPTLDEDLIAHNDDPAEPTEAGGDSVMCQPTANKSMPPEPIPPTWREEEEVEEEDEEAELMARLEALRAKKAAAASQRW